MLESLLSRILPIASMIVMGILLLIQLPRYFARQKPAPPAPEPLPLKALLTRAFALLVLSRALILLTASGLALVLGDGAFFDNPLGAWIRWDANHYLGLAENWYQNQGDPRLHIVFYPLYPLLVRAVRPLCLGNTVLSAFLVSNACLFMAGWALYRLVEAEQGRDAGARALRYLMLCPLSLFFSIPYSEALFLMLTLSSALMARRRRMALAIALGALASATRLLGLLCAVPVFYEFLGIARERAKGQLRSKAPEPLSMSTESPHARILSPSLRASAKQSRLRGFSGLLRRFAPRNDGEGERAKEQPGRFSSELLKGLLLTCLIALGMASYLLLNKVITGDPFTFLTYQREHWGQTFGSLYGTLRYTLHNLFDTGDWGDVLGIWLPQLICILLVSALMCATARRSHPPGGAYALLYFYVALAPTWLLSGPRYLAAMYPLYPMLALVTKKKWQDAAMTALLILMSAYAVYTYAIIGSLL